jgi:predicted ATP-grasp superfamily ATP-dependent carboligase
MDAGAAATAGRSFQPLGLRRIPRVKVHRSIESLIPVLPRSGPPPAVLVGLCSHGLAILRSLTAKGVPVVVIESNWSQPSAQSRHGLKLHHDDLYGESLVALLLELADVLPARPVVFVTNDKMVRLLNGRRDLRAKVHLPFPRPDLLIDLIEKDRLGPLASRQGLRVPETHALSGDDARAVDDAALSGVHFPAVAKPAIPMAAVKAEIVPDRASLQRLASAHPEIGRWLLQQWIEGGDERVHFTAHYFDRSGRARASVAGQKIRQVPRTLGNSSAARGVDRPDLIEEGLRLFRGLDVQGIVSVEFKLDREGVPWFIETTVGRSDYWLKTLLVNGVDLPAIVYSDLAGVDLGASDRQRNRYAWVDGERDLWVFLESWSDPSVSKRRLLLQLIEPKRFALFDVRDPRPYAAWLGPLARRITSGVARRVFRKRESREPHGNGSEPPPAAASVSSAPVTRD